MNGKISFAILLSILLSWGINAQAQVISPRDIERLKKMEDSLVVSADSMYEALIPDSRTAYSMRFAQQLVRALKIPNSYYYGFDTLKKLINIVPADDNSFRIVNWVIEPGNIPKRYYGAIQMQSPQLKLIGLNDYSGQLDKGLEDSILTNNNWYGAFYYRIISHVIAGRKVYTLFGLNSGGLLSNKKVLDPMYFNNKGGVTFGVPIFNVPSPSNPKQAVKRYVLEYKKDIAASMNWDDERQMIVFDKLVSVSNDPSRKYTFVPSGQYDGFIWSNDMWLLQHNLVQINILKDGEAPSE